MNFWSSVRLVLVDADDGRINRPCSRVVACVTDFSARLEAAAQALSNVHERLARRLAPSRRRARKAQEAIMNFQFLLARHERTSGQAPESPIQPGA